MVINLTDLQQCFPRTVTSKLIQFIEPLNTYLPQAGITTTEQITAFLSQTGHESAEYNTTEENLNYSKANLLKTFKKYYTPALAALHANRPIEIGSYVYGNRLGNGSPATRDGWTYRGRGLIQLTGKSNYRDCGAAIKVDLIANPDYAATGQGAVQTACWFWTTRNCNEFVTLETIEKLTRRINGGLNGLQHRRELYERIYPIIKRKFEHVSKVDPDSGPIVDEIQGEEGPPKSES